MTSATHTCTGVVLHCMDFRLRAKLAEALEQRFPAQDYDLVSVAGGVQDLIGEEWREFVFKQLDLSRKLHKPSVIVLIQHEDCGAYGGSATFGDFAKELQAHNEEIRKAKALVKERHPRVAVEGYFIRLSGEMIPLEDQEEMVRRETSVLQRTH